MTVTCGPSVLPSQMRTQGRHLWCKKTKTTITYGVCQTWVYLATGSSPLTQIKPKPNLNMSVKTTDVCQSVSSRARGELGWSMIDDRLIRWKTVDRLQSFEKKGQEMIHWNLPKFNKYVSGLFWISDNWQWICCGGETSRSNKSFNNVPNLNFLGRLVLVQTN